MTLNPQAQGRRERAGVEDIIGLEGASVVTAPSHTAGDDVAHEVVVSPDHLDSAIQADVRVDMNGDVMIPEEGSRVVIGYRINSRPIVLGQRYTIQDDIPEFEPGERVLGHPSTGSHVRFANDGTLRVEADGGNTVVLKPNGDVVLNGGSTAPVTDVSTTKDTDGHVTSISLTRADGVFVPSN